MFRPPSRHAFTLIEMITVIAIIAILAGLVLSINGVVQRKAGTARAETEIRTLSAGCEAYKTDNGGYPRAAIKDDPVGNYSSDTDKLDPVVDFNSAPPPPPSYPPTKYSTASVVLYKALSGDTDANGQIDTATETGKNYVPDFFKPSRLGGYDKTTGTFPKGVVYIRDPFGNVYGYSTAGLKAEQDFRVGLTTDPTAKRTSAGYNSTFDLWSTGGQSSSTGTPKWVKNW